MTYQVSWSNRFEVKPDRWVYQPTALSKKNGQIICNILNKKWKKPSYYYHLRSGGHVQALKKHLDNNYFIAVDLQNFFGSISRSRVTRSLKSFLSYNVARKIAKESTVKSTGSCPHSHYLPYGFVQSPLLASVCLFYSSLGTLLYAINRNALYTLSVYMDDIVISSNNAEMLDELYKTVCEVTNKSGFIINKKKSQSVSSRIDVFNITLSHQLLEITNERFIKFQQIYTTSQSQAQKDGIQSYVYSVNPSQVSLL